MKDYQTRVIKEKKELDEKLKKLDNFIVSDKSKNVTGNERILLVRQLCVMQEYSWVLDERIKNFD